MGLSPDKIKRLRAAPVTAGTLVKVVADVLHQFREAERADTAKQIDAALNQKCLVDFKGVWDEHHSYQRGAAVTCSGSLFIATAPCSAGERPGRAAGWRLAVKSEPKKPPVLR